MRRLSREQGQVLEKLRNPKLGDIDLTGQGVQRLRDKKARKILGPVLDEALLRRKKGIEVSSYYRALRVRLLPDNPFFLDNVAQLRRVFGIPVTGLPADLVPESNELREWGTTAMNDIRRRNAASWCTGSTPAPLEGCNRKDWISGLCREPC